ncbi:hypothetical protein KEM55_004378 [Ascosphaera atra]|nr:hypothetical protein KEM55_004378 [Ascosphaera atra]
MAEDSTTSPRGATETDTTVDQLRQLVIFLQADIAHLYATSAAPPAAAAPANTDDPPPTRRARQIRDLPSPPRYSGRREKASARHWLRECIDRFDLEQNLAGVVTTDAQRVMLASHWLDGNAWKAWEATKQASDTNAGMTQPRTWSDFAAWILSRFDELNAQTRLLADFKKIRQRTDIQTYATEFQIAYALSQAHWDEHSLRLHFIDSLKPALQLEWKRLRDKPTTFEEMLTELIRLEDVTAGAVQHRQGSQADRGSYAVADAGDPMDLDTLNAVADEPRPPRKGTYGWSEWCRRHKACYECAAKDHRAADCTQRRGRNGRRQPGRQKGGGGGGKRDRRDGGYGPSQPIDQGNERSR